MTVDGAALTYNGEIYNHLSIRAELQRLGHVFKTRSDTETLLHACRQWGADAILRLRGMFAFAFHDKERGRLLLARDRVGKKPLFYTFGSWGLAFSSELEPLWQTLGPWKLNAEALDQYLAWQYVPAPLTIYQGVHCLEPGHVLEIDLRTGRHDIRRYWDVRFSIDRTLAVEEWDRLIEDKIREATALRLMSDVPFGAFLSGGIDSSLVVAHMAELLDHPVQTFCVGYAEEAYSELAPAAKVAEILGTEHHSRVLGPECLDILPDLVRHYGQPFADSSAVPTWHVSAMARDSVKMVLSGDGGDEVFAGYNTYESILSDVRPDLAGGPGGSVLSRILRCFPSRSKQPPSLATLHQGCYGHFREADRRQLLRGSWAAAVSDRSDFVRSFLDALEVPLVSRLQLCDLHTYLPNDILTKVDIASMANSLEVRSPLLDHELIELAATLPVEQRVVRDGARYEKKVLLRRLARRRFPADIIERRKMGFGLPMGPWLAGRIDELRRQFRENTVLLDVVDPAALDRLLAGHSVATDASARIWNILVLAQWLETHPESLQ
ncbi:Asparagine synthetase [Magnetospirillum sp. LM-5]|nr:Asparagine synthetase [Magnetospirillum sp. LM-5]